MSNKLSSYSRFWEIDFMRGVAIIMMITFHFLYDLNMLSLAKVNLWTGFWGVFQKTTASTFILLAGISVYISKISRGKKVVSYIKGGGFIFASGLILTIVTYIAYPRCFIKFGILHLIGGSIILSYFFKNFKYWNIPIALSLIFLGYIFRDIYVESENLFFLGLRSKGYAALDHFPLLPWFGVFLMGIILGLALYPEGIRRLTFLDRIPQYSFTRILCFLGKNSLIIYLVHQIILFGIALSFFYFKYGSLPL